MSIELGVGIFYEGKLHNGPFLSLCGDKYGCFFSSMHNGRPADSSYLTYFCPNDTKKHVDSLHDKTDVSGLQSFSGQIDKEKRDNGVGKHWDDDGNVYIGLYKDDYRTEGKYYKLQSDGSFILYPVKYEEGFI